MSWPASAAWRTRHDVVDVQVLEAYQAGVAAFKGQTGGDLEKLDSTMDELQQVGSGCWARALVRRARGVGVTRGVGGAGLVLRLPGVRSCLRRCARQRSFDGSVWPTHGNNMSSERSAAHDCIEGKSSRLEHDRGRTSPKPGMYAHRVQPNGPQRQRWALRQRGS